MNNVGLIVQSTPEKATTVKLLLRIMSTKDKVVTVKERASSAMRWSGLARILDASSW